MKQTNQDPKKVRQGCAIIAVLSLIIIVVFAAMCDTEPEVNNAQSNDVALQKVKKEPKVKEAFINEAGVLYVSVIDDGTNRTGYAQYLCEVLKENKASASHVKIVKFNSMNDPQRDNAYGVLLGEHNCNE